MKVSRETQEPEREDVVFFLPLVEHAGSCYLHFRRGDLVDACKCMWNMSELEELVPELSALPLCSVDDTHG